MNSDKGKRKNKIVIAAVFLIATLLLITAGILYFYPYLTGYERQAEEESLALRYLEQLQEKDADIDVDESWIAVKESSEAADIESHEENTEKQQETQDTREPWSDDVWYSRDGVTYTPDYAAGTLDCVLIIPEIQLCRGVYTGSWEEIIHNLDVWMVTAARPDYDLGTTHYCIYGHNTPRLDLSFNRLQSLQEGDLFYLVNSNGVYQYQVTDTFGVSRSESTRYTDDFSIESEICYLITCGRDEYRYLNLIIEGTLDSVTAVHEVDLEALFLK